MTAPAEPITLRAESARKAIHLASGSVPLLYARGADRGALIGLLCAVATVALGVEWARHRSLRVEAMFERAAGPMLRPDEQRTLTGATWLILASLAAVLCLPQRPALATLWCITVADPIATLAGRALRRHQYAQAGKSMVGSAAFFVTSLAGIYLVARSNPGTALAIAMIATLAERYPGPLNDNVAVAIGAALTASLVT